RRAPALVALAGHQVGGDKRRGDARGGLGEDGGGLGVVAARGVAAVGDQLGEVRRVGAGPRDVERHVRCTRERVRDRLVAALGGGLLGRQRGERGGVGVR